MISYLKVFSLIAAMLITSGGVPARQAASSPAPQPPIRQWPRSHNYDVQHYRIALDLDLTARAIAGETTITLRPFGSDFDKIEIDAGEMTIKSVKLADGGQLAFKQEPNDKLVVSLGRPYPANRDLSLVISYGAVPKKGLTFIGQGRSALQVWSQGESEFNHYWFPCYDYPNDPATVELMATVDDKYQVISNGLLSSVRPSTPSGRKIWHWKLDRPISTYLISIVVGNYAEIKDEYDGIPMVSYVYPDQVENARISIGNLAEMAAFFTDRIGLKYPYPRYSQTTVTDFNGGMENATATTLSDTYIHDNRAHLDLSSDEVVAHELAHSWFGNMITCRYWGDLWLNEGFASFFADAWTEHKRGRDDYRYAMMANQKAYLQSWARGIRHPISIDRYDDPETLFDAYPYQRGAAVLGMLRFVLGEELFWKSVRHYAKKHQWQNVETPQLIAAIEEATGQNLGWFFDEWVFKMGHPEFEVTKKYDPGEKSLTLTVKQSTKREEKQPWFQTPDYFRTPVEIAINTEAGEAIHRVWIDRPEQEFKFQVASKPSFVNFDRGNYIIKQMRFEQSAEELSNQLRLDRDVTGRLRAAAELKVLGNDSAVRALATAAANDSFWGVRYEAVLSLGQLRTDAARAALIQATKDKNSRVRRVAVQGLGFLKDKTLAELFIRLIKNDQSYFVIADAARALGRTEADSALGVLSGLLKQDSWQDTVRIGAVAGFSELKDPRAAQLLIDYTKPQYSNLLRAPVIQALGYLGKGNESVVAALVGTLTDESSRMVLLALSALGNIGSPTALPAIENLQSDPKATIEVRAAAKTLAARLRTENPR